MDDIAHTQSKNGMLTNGARFEEDATLAEPSGAGLQEIDGAEDGRQDSRRVGRRRLGRSKQSHSHKHFKVYRRRWVGLAQLVLLNIVVSWDVR